MLTILFIKLVGGGGDGKKRTDALCIRDKLKKKKGVFDALRCSVHNSFFIKFTP